MLVYIFPFESFILLKVILIHLFIAGKFAQYMNLFLLLF